MISKNILIVNEGLALGGIETYLVRISRKLAQDGHTVKFLFFSNSFDKQLLAELTTYGTVFFYDDYILGAPFFKKTSPLLKLLAPCKSQKLQVDLFHNLTHAVATDFNAALFAGRIFPKNSTIKLLIGIYHINEFDFSKHPSWYFKALTDKLLTQIPPRNLVMYNQAVKDKYNNDYTHRFAGNHIITLGIDVEKMANVWAGKQNQRIVSIGRLTKWKRYNHSIIEVIHDFKEKGITYYYDCYGDGEERGTLTKMVHDLGLSSQITFYSSVPYEKFAATITDSLMFIGAGTALIEASACGLPALIGIENETKPVSYGFLHHTTGSSYQEKQLALPAKHIATFITQLTTCNTAAYKRECESAKLRSEYFSLDKAHQGFNGYLEESSDFIFKLHYFQIIHVIVSMLLNKIFKPKTHYANRL